MLTGTDRRDCEQRFHDEQAAERAESFHSGQADLVFRDEDYLDHETWVRPAFERLGSLAGKSALDYGCGHGMAAVVMARAGARVSAFDLSPGYVRETRERARANGVRIECLAADGEDLPFPDAAFDAIWGNAILHHLDLARAGRELVRVLKPGGVAVFCEPWGGNPALALARNWLPYPGKNRTPDEKPLTSADLEPLHKLFPAVEVEGWQLLGMVCRVWRGRLLCSALDRFDRRLLALAPGLANWCRYAVIDLRRAT
jgi:SAM-dependent methyltransferase